MNKIKFLIILFTLALFNIAYALEDKIIAIVNDNVVLNSELNNKLATINLEGTSRLEAAKLKRDVLDQIIEESLLEQAANRLGIYISDIDLQNRIKLIAQNQNLTVLQLKEAVEAQNIDYLKSQIGNPDGEENPNKKYYDPRKWIREGEKSFVERLSKAFHDLNNVNTL